FSSCGSGTDRRPAVALRRRFRCARRSALRLHLGNPESRGDPRLVLAGPIAGHLDGGSVPAPAGPVSAPSVDAAGPAVLGGVRGPPRCWVGGWRLGGGLGPRVSGCDHWGPRRGRGRLAVRPARPVSGLAGLTPDC